MTRIAQKLTPEVLVTAPRRSAGVPNCDARLILYTETSYSLDDHERKPKKLCLLDVGKNEVLIVLEDSSLGDFQWLEPTNGQDGEPVPEIILLMGTGDGQTDILVGDPRSFADSRRSIGVISGSASNLKICRLSSKEFAIAFSASTDPDGALYNPQTAPKPHTSGRLYRSCYARHWDDWIGPNRNSIWYSQLTRNQESGLIDPAGKFFNALRDTWIESPMPPFGGTDNFDLGPHGLAIVARDPDLQPGFNTKCNLYLAQISSFTEQPDQVLQIPVPSGFEGAMTSPVFSDDGKRIAWLAMKENGYEADLNHILFVDNVCHPEEVFEYCLSGWDRSPSALAWRSDGKGLYIQAEDQGRSVAFCSPITGHDTSVEQRNAPDPLHLRGSVSSMVPLPGNTLFTTSSSLTTSVFYSVTRALTTDTDASSYLPAETISTTSSLFGLLPSSVRSIHSPAAKPSIAIDGRIHSWVVLPPHFDESKKYPLAFLIHGGPQGAWMDAWSTRWNPAVWAAQGYVVVLPNPTGSTGYGQRLTDSIKNQWGGLPYEDLVRVFQYLKDEVSYVDTDRAICAGASFGGYMTNWIAGHLLGVEFKALFTHDGTFSTLYQAATDELYFPHREFDGTFARARDQGWTAWDPSRFADNFKVPHLIVHSDKDYRLLMAEGLAMFNVLQEKGVESQLLAFPDEGHWVLQPENSLKWHQVVFSFLNEKVGLSVPKEWADNVRKIVMDPEVDARRKRRTGANVVKLALGMSKTAP